jgi:cytochrome c biogenesis protein CcdA
MVGAIGPHVQGKRQLRDSGGSVTLFALGAVIGALVTGSLVGLLGSAAQALAGEHVLAVVVGAAGCALLLADLGFFGLRTPTLRRQTSSAWYRKRGPRAAWALWGLDLGLGFSTIRLSSLYWLMVLFVAAFVSPVLAPLVFALYGLGLGVAFAAAVVVQTQRDSSGAHSPGLGLLRAARPVRLVSDAFLGLVSITIVLTWGAPWW